jgi:hypothetical protein
MVSAALRFAEEEETSVTYSSQDAALLNIHETLNWYAAHSEYKWPDFIVMGYDFD